jgi:uncharacterized protein (TIGR02266 family)
MRHVKWGREAQREESRRLAGSVVHSPEIMAAHPPPPALPERIRRLLDREARLAERERALLERRLALPAAAREAADAAVNWTDTLAEREAQASERAEALLIWSEAMERAVVSSPVAPPAPEGVFWESLSERLGVMLAHELPELGSSGVTDVVERALNAVGVAVRSRPPSAVPPPLSPVTGSAVAEEAELLAGVGGPTPAPDLEEAPSMTSFIRALDAVLPEEAVPEVAPPSGPPDEPEALDPDPVLKALLLAEAGLPPSPPALPEPPDLMATTAGFEALVFAAPEAASLANDAAMNAFGELPTPLPGETDDAFAALLAEAGFPPAAAAPPPWPEPAPPAELDDPFAALAPALEANVAEDAEDAEDAPPVDEFASFAALSLELHSAIEQSVEALTGAASEPTPPLAAPAVSGRPHVADEHEMALRMTEEVHLSDTEIANIFASGPPRRDAFAFEVPPEPPEPATPPPSDDDDPFADLESALEAGRLGALPARDAGDDPFADLAAELADFDPPTGSGRDSDPDMMLEPIPGYDMRLPVDTPVPSGGAPVPSIQTLAPAPALPTQPAPTAARAPASEVPMTFRPTLGRVDRPRGATGPLRPVARPSDRGASTFAALAAEMDIEGVDPWRELDISDLRSAGHPGPLPTPPPQPISPARQRAIADRTHRANLAVKVGVEYGTSFFTGFSGNVSRGGLFVATHQTIPVGARVELFFEMPDGHSVAAPAQVRWVRDIEQADLDGSAPGIGLAFVNLTHDDAIILERYVATHAASVLYDDDAAPP